MKKVVRFQKRIKKRNSKKLAAKYKKETDLKNFKPYIANLLIQVIKIKQKINNCG